MWVCNSLGFFVAAFSIALGKGISLDAEVLDGMHGVVFARARYWTNLWVEMDKILLSNDKSITWRIKVCWPRYEDARCQVSLRVVC